MTTQTNVKTFTIAGTSFCKGLHKVRHANDIARIKVLDKTGHTEIVLVTLPHAMSKVDAAEFIKDLPEFESELNQTTIADYIADQSGNVEPKEPKVKKEKKAKVEPEVVDGDTAEVVDGDTAEVVIQTAEVAVPEIVLAKTEDTVTAEEWQTLQAVSSAKG
jgi:hypothetical protein